MAIRSMLEFSVYCLSVSIRIGVVDALVWEDVAGGVES